MHAHGQRGVAYAEHVSGAKHKAHMGIMLLVMLGLGAMAAWQHFHPPTPDLLLIDPSDRM